MSQPYNPESPDDQPFQNVREIVSRTFPKEVDAIIVTFRQVTRAMVNSGNSTVWFKDFTEPPTREQILARALQQGAIRDPASRGYTGTALDPVIGPNGVQVGYVASIEQLDYTFPEVRPVVELTPRAEVEHLTDDQLVALAHQLGYLAGDISE